MDASMMDMNHSPSPTSSSGMIDSSSGNMMMTMQMWFQATTKVTLWFKEWDVDSHGKYAASIVGLLVLCLLQEAISRTRTLAARQLGSSSSYRAYDSSAADETPQSESLFNFASYRKALPCRIALSLLYALNLTTSYLLMLAVMTFNVGFFITIVFGLGLGHFIFAAPAAPSSNSSSILSEACCPQS